MLEENVTTGNGEQFYFHEMIQRAEYDMIVYIQLSLRNQAWDRGEGRNIDLLG